MRQAYWDHAEGQPVKTRKRRRRSKNVTHDYIFGSLDRLAAAHEAVIWLGTGLADQLALAWMPQSLRVIGGPAESLRIVQFERTLSGAAIPTISNSGKKARLAATIVRAKARRRSLCLTRAADGVRRATWRSHRLAGQTL